MKEFIIPFFGLKIGKHEFKFKIDHEFFEAFDSALIENVKANVDLVLEKTATMLILDFSAKGSSVVPCDRCGDDFELSFKAGEKLFIKFGDEAYDQTDDVMVVSHDTHEIDVSHRIYEMLILNFPKKRVHPKLKDCNSKAIEKLNEINSQEEDGDKTDPRWEALKKLK
ncbi:MAG: DUF177 domain-containing protein [Cryomorphaceae bacterium]|nr:DUF177 domain-containing protein [Flavobacteriales bacterium]